MVVVSPVLGGRGADSCYCLETAEAAGATMVAAGHCGQIGAVAGAGCSCSEGCSGPTNVAVALRCGGCQGGGSVDPGGVGDAARAGVGHCDHWGAAAGGG